MANCIATCSVQLKGWTSVFYHSLFIQCIQHCAWVGSHYTTRYAHIAHTHTHTDMYIVFWSHDIFYYSFSQISSVLWCPERTYSVDYEYDNNAATVTYSDLGIDLSNVYFFMFQAMACNDIFIVLASAAGQFINSPFYGIRLYSSSSSASSFVW